MQFVHPPFPRPDVDWQAFARELGGVPSSREAGLLRRRSQDMNWFSPVLKPLFAGLRADIVVTPRDEADVMAVARACVRHRVPLTVRGAGTGNYGQAVPLHGGVVLDTSSMTAVRWLRDGAARCEPGIKMSALEETTRKAGWELRLFPSTKRTATIGGFLAGGSSGVGAIRFGFLRDLGNILGIRVVTMEEEPRVIELRGPDVNRAAHAFGTNGIITEVEIGLAPAESWVDVIVAFDDLLAATRFGQALSDADGLVKNEVAIFDAAIAPYFPTVHGHIGPGKHTAFLMVAEQSMEGLGYLARDHGGAIVYKKPDPESGRTRPLYEYTWNHTTLHALNADPGITYLQSFLPHGRVAELVEHLRGKFGDELPFHLEWVRWEGETACDGLQLVRYTTEERLREVIAYHESIGVTVFDPHTYVLEDGGMKVVDPAQLEFKRDVDPHGLLNPGKMRGWWERKAVAGRDRAIFR
ncbi:MAG: FAD-binding oxidoreductase [SAR202 cluster bacterium]|nr:FAD-binding oxidoreductase [SAR202 cluster bacterium]